MQIATHNDHPEPASIVGMPTLLTTEEAATVLRVRPSWLERQAASRRIPFAMLGGSYRFTTDHLRRIVEIFEATPPQTADNTEPAPVREMRTTRRTASPQTVSTVTPLRPRPRQPPCQAAA